MNPLTVALIGVLGITCLSDVQADDSILSPVQVNYLFDRLFGDRESFEPSVFITMLTRLHEHRMEVDPTRREIVEFWRDAVLDKQEHCTAEFMSKLEQERQKYLANRYNKHRIYDFVKDKVVSDCRHRFLRGVRRVVDGWKPEDINMLHELGIVWTNINHDKLTSELSKSAARAIAARLPLAVRKSRNDFAETWRHGGPCARFLDELEGPIMEIERFYEKFDTGYKSYKVDSKEAYAWVQAVQGCNYFSTDKALDDVWPHVQKL